MNRKAAIGLNMLQYLPRIIFTVVVLLSVVFLVKIFIQTEVSITGAETSMLAQSILFSDAISYYDNSINALYPGIIDLDKFNADNFEQELMKSLSYGTTNSHIAAKLSLKSFKGSLLTRYYNRHYYDRFIQLSRLAPGLGGTTAISYDFYVLARSNNGLDQSVLSIEVVMPNG